MAITSNRRSWAEANIRCHQFVVYRRGVKVSAHEHKSGAEKAAVYLNDVWGAGTIETRGRQMRQAAE